MRVKVQLHINILTAMCIGKLTSRLQLSPLDGQPLTNKLLHRFPIARPVIVADCGKGDHSLQCRLRLKPKKLFLFANVKKSTQVNSAWDISMAKTWLFQSQWVDIIVTSSKQVIFFSDGSQIWRCTYLAPFDRRKQKDSILTTNLPRAGAYHHY